MIVLVAIIGVSNNLWHPPALAYLSQRYPQVQGYVFSLHVEGASVADSLAPLIAGALMAWITWKGAVAVGIAPAFLAAGLHRLIASILLASDRPVRADDGKEGISFLGFLSGLEDDAPQTAT